MGNEKFRIWATIAWGYKHAFRNIPAVFRLGWLPMTINCLVFISLPYVILLKNEGYIAAFIFLETLAIGYFAVRWHRKILLGEQPSSGASLRRPVLVYCSILLVINFWKEGLELIGSFLGISLTATVPIVIAGIFFLLLAVSIQMVLPAIAVNDRKMSLDRAWELWRGNRIRFVLFLIIGEALITVAWLLAHKASSFLSTQLMGLLEVDFQSVLSYGSDFVRFMFSFGVTAPFLTIILFVLGAGFVGGLSISYAGIARRAIDSDIAYQPPNELRVRFAD